MSVAKKETSLHRSSLLLLNDGLINIEVKLIKQNKRTPNIV